MLGMPEQMPQLLSPPAFHHFITTLLHAVRREPIAPQGRAVYLSRLGGSSILLSVGIIKN